MWSEADYASIPDGDHLLIAADNGLCAGTRTLEIDLLNCGWGREICLALQELALSDAAKARAADWLNDLDSTDEAQLLKDVAPIGKGRFAQRLASLARNGEWDEPAQYMPKYIVDALRHVAEELGIEWPAT